MKTIEKEFVKNNFKHRQIYREGDLAIYERCRIGSEDPHWEAIKISKQKERTLPNGTKHEAGEYYPSSEQWGTYGFTCLTKDAAYSRLERMKEIKSKSPPTAF